MADINTELAAYHELKVVKPMTVLCSTLGKIENAPRIKYHKSSIDLKGHLLVSAITRGARRHINRQISRAALEFNQSDISQRSHVRTSVLPPMADSFDSTGHPTKYSLEKVGRVIVTRFLPPAL